MKPKRITAYTHPPLESSTQEPDTKPGPYYISILDGPKFALLSGPYELHAEALALVEKARGLAQSHSPWAAFWSFGTCRCKPDTGPGYLQKKGFNLQLEKE